MYYFIFWRAGESGHAFARRNHARLLMTRWASVLLEVPLLHLLFHLSSLLAPVDFRPVFPANHVFTRFMWTLAFAKGGSLLLAEKIDGNRSHMR